MLLFGFPSLAHGWKVGTWGSLCFARLRYQTDQTYLFGAWNLGWPPQISFFFEGMYSTGARTSYHDTENYHGFPYWDPEETIEDSSDVHTVVVDGNPVGVLRMAVDDILTALLKTVVTEP